MLPETIKKLYKFRGGGKGLSFWANVNRNGFGRLVFYKVRMIKEKLQEILRTNLRSSAEELGIHYGFIVVEDSSSQHRYDLIRSRYDREEITQIRLPGNSPGNLLLILDLNPIETCFYHLKKRVFKGIYEFIKLKELKRAIKKAWKELQNNGRFLIESMVLGY